MKKRRDIDLARYSEHSSGRDHNDHILDLAITLGNSKNHLASLMHYMNVQNIGGPGRSHFFYLRLASLIIWV